MSSAEYSCKLFKPIFCIQVNSVYPDQTAPKSILIWVHTVCRNDFQNHKQMTKQTTILVIGALKVKKLYAFPSDKDFSPIQSYIFSQFASNLMCYNVWTSNILLANSVDHSQISQSNKRCCVDRRYKKWHNHFIYRGIVFLNKRF